MNQTTATEILTLLAFRGYKTRLHYAGAIEHIANAHHPSLITHHSSLVLPLAPRSVAPLP